MLPLSNSKDAPVIETNVVARDALREELARLKLQLGVLIAGANATVLIVMLAAMSLWS